MNNVPGLFACRPILSVENVGRSIEYYVGTLGFRIGWAWSDLQKKFLQPGDNDTPTFALVGCGNIQLMLSRKSQGAPGMWLHFDVHTADQLDTLHDEWRQKGALITEPPSLRPWGAYEMRMQDPDGHTFRVASPPRG